MEGVQLFSYLNLGVSGAEVIGMNWGDTTIQLVALAVPQYFMVSSVWTPVPHSWTHPSSLLRIPHYVGLSECSRVRHWCGPRAILDRGR